MQNCNICNSVLLQKVDFRTNKNSEICVNCEGIEPTNKEIVNASPFFTCKLAPITTNDIIPDWKPVPEDQLTPIRELATSSKPRLEYMYKEVMEACIRCEGNIHEGKININWSKVIGYEPIKYTITQAINSKSKKKTHVLIVGAAGTSKTVFLKTVEESLKTQNLNVHYLDATTLSSAGVIQYLFDNEVSYCLLDEIDKLEKEHQRVFLNMLESGILQETKGKKNGIRKKDMKDTVFIATGNYIEKIMFPLLTRFMTLKIPEYTKEEFYAIGIKLLMEQYNKTQEIASYIVDKIYTIYTEIRKEKPNLRQAVQVATLTDNTKKEIDLILEGISKYSQSYEE